MKNTEEWKIYKFGRDFDNHYQLHFSKFGEVKSFNKNYPDGKIINGSLRQGYPIISFTQFDPINDEVKAEFTKQENEISELRLQIRNLKKLALKKSTIGRELSKIEREIADLTKDLQKSIDKLSKQRKKDLKKRRLNFHLLVHKAVAELFIPNDDPENKKFVIHKNFDKKDNRVENLDWATREEVVARSFKSPNYISYKINKPQKDPTSISKLSHNDVVFIKRKLEKGEPMARLARRFGVSDMQIHRIKTGENWGNVKLSLISK